MLKIDRRAGSFSPLEAPTLAEARILERSDLQEYICNSSRDFFAEIGERLFVLGQEISPSETVSDRIDILAIDAEGTTVVVELKRGSNKLQIFQAISYAGMISHWGESDFRDRVSEEKWEALVDFLEVDTEEINRTQRVLLIAEGFDYALLSGAEWLSERYGVDIRCTALALATDKESGAEYLACSSVFPSPALAERALTRGAGTRTTRPSKWADWNAALEAIENEVLRRFAKRELDAGRESYLRRRTFHYRIEGRRRWSLLCRKKAAYVWQRGRFDGDEAYWAECLDDQESVAVVKGGAALRFSLSSEADLEAFTHAVEHELGSRPWTKSAFPAEQDDEPEGN